MTLYLESHSGWTANADPMTGGHDILDANGWALAKLNYDYRYTSNGTNHARAQFLAAAPELLDALEAIIDDMGADGLCTCQHNKTKALDAYEKATGRRVPA